jgi:hypothetical protein
MGRVPLFGLMDYNPVGGNTAKDLKNHEARRVSDIATGWDFGTRHLPPLCRKALSYTTASMTVGNPRADCQLAYFGANRQAGRTPTGVLGRREISDRWRQLLVLSPTRVQFDSEGGMRGH